MACTPTKTGWGVQGVQVLMLLLQRHTNESIVIQDRDDPSKCCFVRVVDVYPTGDVTLGLLGDGYSFVRNEIFNRTTKEDSAHEEITKEKEKSYGSTKSRMYG